MVTPCWQEAGTSVALFQVHDGCFDAALGLELFQQALDVDLDGSLGDMEHGGDLLVGQPLGDFTHDLHLASGQALQLLLQVV